MNKHIQPHKHFRKLDAGLLLAILLSLIAAWSFIARPTLLHGDDTRFHIIRIAEFSLLLRSGVLFPRWASDFMNGYGYPIFNYYAPLTYYVASFFSLANPAWAVFGFRMATTAGFLTAGTGMYGLGRHLKDERAGLIAATCYLFAPYVFLIDPHLRGDIPEFLALALAPALFWAYAVHSQRASRRTLIAASGLTAAVILTHNLLALVFFSMLLAATVWHHLPAGHGALPTPAQAARNALPLVIGLLLAGFFWLPVLLERNAVQLGNLIYDDHYHFANHFMTTAELFAMTDMLNLSHANPPVLRNFGVAQWGGAAIATVGLLLMAVTGKSAARQAQGNSLRYGIFWLLCFTVLTLLMLPLSEPIWNAVSPMKYLQFPWRLIGPAVLALSVLSVHIVHLIDYLPARIGPYLTTLVILLPVIFATPVFIPYPQGLGIERINQIDRTVILASGANGTTATNDFLPADVQVMPAPSADLVESYHGSGPIDRVNRSVLPEGVSVTSVKHSPTRDLFEIKAAEPFTLHLNTFMFPGWKASVDNKPAEVFVTGAEGLIGIAVPAGEHTVRVWLGITPARIAGWLATLLGAAGLWLAAKFWFTPSQKHEHSRALKWHPGLLAILILAWAVTGWIGVFQNRGGTPTKNIEHLQEATLFGGINLTGYNLPDRPVQPGEQITVRLYWQARELPVNNLRVFSHFITIPEHTYTQSDKINPAGFDTSEWAVGWVYMDKHTLLIPLGTPPGNYTLRVGLWDGSTGQRMLVMDETGAVIDDAINLSVPITVVPAQTQPGAAELPLDTIISAPAAPGITLLGVHREPPGVINNALELLEFDLYWRAEQDDLPAYSLLYRVLNTSGDIIHEGTAQLTDGLYPTTKWQSGQVVLDVQSMWLDQGFPTDLYTIEVGLVKTEDEQPSKWVPAIEFERTLP